MTRVHDMGGRFGDGAVIPEAEGDVFHEDWHARALALTLAGGVVGQWNIDTSRHMRESLAPTDYARFSYYEKWLAGLSNLLVEKGVLTIEELAGGDVSPSELAERILRAEAVEPAMSKGGPADRDSDIAPRFRAGDRVRTRRQAENTSVVGGHTRLPVYASGAVGTVVRYHGTHVLPDTNAHGLGENPEPLYAVAFPASELWAQPEHPNDDVVLDLWDSYLDPV